MQTLIHEVQRIEKSAHLQQANFSWRKPSFLKRGKDLLKIPYDFE
jgi:hypothetical protein